MLFMACRGTECRAYAMIVWHGIMDPNNQAKETSW